MKKTTNTFLLACLSSMLILFLWGQKNPLTKNVIYLHEHVQKDQSALTVLNELSSTGNVVLKFYADWCGPCRRMTPLIDNIASTMLNLTFISIDRDQFLDLAKHFGITSIPTLIFLRNGTIIGRYDGKALSEKELAQLISKTFNK